MGGGDGGWWPTGCYCQSQAPFGFNRVLVLIGTWLGLGLGDLGAEGFGPGLDNKKFAHCQDLILSQTFYQIDSTKIMAFSY